MDPPHAVGPGRRARRQHAAHTLADADRRAGRRDITQPDHEVGVRAAGPDIQFGGHRSDDVQPGRERPACEGEHILARLKAAVVLGPGVADEGWPVQRGRGVLRIVTVGIGRRRGGRIGREAAPRLQVPPLRPHAWHRPVGVAAPLTRAGDVQPDRTGGQRGCVIKEVGAKPGERIRPRRTHLARVAVIPGSNGQPRLLPRAPKALVVPQLPGQKDVVPAAEHAHRSDHPGDVGAVVATAPVGAVDGGVSQHILVEGHGHARGEGVELRHRHTAKRRAPGAADRGETRGQPAHGAFDAGGQIAPAERGLQGEGPADIRGLVHL